MAMGIQNHGGASTCSWRGWRIMAVITYNTILRFARMEDI